LGKAARTRVEKFIENYQADPGIVQLGISSDLDRAISLAPIPDRETTDRSRKNLVEFLEWYGLNATLADLHASVIEAQIVSAVRERKLRDE
jgi:hypothetical protein